MLGALVELSADKYKSAGNACPAYPLPLLEKVRAPSPTIFLESDLIKVYLFNDPTLPPLPHRYKRFQF